MAFASERSNARALTVLCGANTVFNLGLTSFDFARGSWPWGLLAIGCVTVSGPSPSSTSNDQGGSMGAIGKPKRIIQIPKPAEVEKEVPQNWPEQIPSQTPLPGLPVPA